MGEDEGEGGRKGGEGGKEGRGGEGERKGVLDIRTFKHFLIRPFLVSIHSSIYLSLHENQPKRLH